jgi:hypothetical protein
MEGERRTRQVQQGQAWELVYNVFSYFKREARAGMPVHDVAKAQELTAVWCAIQALEVCKDLLARATSQFVFRFLSARHPPSFVSVTLRWTSSVCLLKHHKCGELRRAHSMQRYEPLHPCLTHQYAAP